MSGFQEKIAAIVGGWEEDPRQKNLKVTLGPPPKKNRLKFPFKGTIDFQDIKILVENPKGTFREGTDASGHHWKTLMKAHYGEIQKTEGADGDKVDVYVGENPKADQVFIVHQNHPKDHPTKAGQWDEDKTILGVDSAEDAKKLYLSQYDDPSFFRSITTMSLEQFKKSLKENRGEKIATDGSYAGKTYQTRKLTEQIEQARAAGVRDDKIKQVLREKDITKPEPANIQFTVEGKRSSVMLEKLSREEAYQAGVEAALQDMGLTKGAAGAPANPYASIGAPNPPSYVPQHAIKQNLTPMPPQQPAAPKATAGVGGIPPRR